MGDKIRTMLDELHSDMTDAEFERKKSEIYEALDAI